MIVDLRRSQKTVYEKVWYVKGFFAWLGKKPLAQVVREDVRAYLKEHKGCSAAKYKNMLGSLKTFFRDFLCRPEVVATFRFPKEPFKPKIVPSRNDIQKFFQNLSSLKERTLFLLYATSGLRRNEVLGLCPESIDLRKRMITPTKNESKTKVSWISFYSEETEKLLMEYLSSRKPSRSKRIFPMPREEERRLWKTAREKTGINITPQRLREWFCCEMALLGVSDRYIDAFCGRVPRSILARHYTDYSPEKLKRIYDKAALKVLN